MREKQIILFLAANPAGTSLLALAEEARAIQVELERSGYRECFEFETRWAAQPLDLLRELRRLKPTVVHFSGHGGQNAGRFHAGNSSPYRDVVDEQRVGDQHSDQREPDGLFFHGDDGRPKFVSAEAIADTFGAAGASVKLVVLNACFTDVQAEALVAHVDCVVGMRGSILDNAARIFALGLYGGLGEGESLAAAYKGGRAAIKLEGQYGGDLPQLKTRAGFDATRCILAANDLVSTAGNTTAPAGSAPPKTDIGILTIRPDEFRAVLGVFPTSVGIFKGAHREYALRQADAGGGKRYTVAVLRQPEQGNGEAQDAARDLIEDLSPALVVVVGIAGGVPSSDFTLGDVVISMRIQDFTVEARETGKPTAYATTGGPVDKAIAGAIANLPARDRELGDWTADLGNRPPVVLEDNLYGPPTWRDDLQRKLTQHHGPAAKPRLPLYVSGTIGSSDRLVKDPELVIPLLATMRDLLAVEMESGGVYRAARERCAMIAIRGISDIVGLKRQNAWTTFACASAAAFTRAFLRTQPIPVSVPKPTPSPRIDSRDNPPAPPVVNANPGLQTLLAMLPMSNSFEARSMLLDGMSMNLNRSQTNKLVDLTMIVNQLRGMQLPDGSLCLVVLIDNALPFADGLIIDGLDVYQVLIAERTVLVARS